ncbi:phospholipase c beta [Chamberlinius hualienensis]
MAGAKPGVHVVQLKPIVVPRTLQEGGKFIKWDDDSGQAVPVTLRVDKKGYFLYWTDQNKEVEFLSISEIRDTRTGKYARTPKDPKLQYYMNIGSQDTPLEEKTVTIVYGPDFVNVSFLNFCCDRKETAKEWTDEILVMAYNLLALNGSATSFLEKAHTKIILSLDKEGKIPVKNIVKTFAQNREDKKRVEKALEATGLSFAKNETICPTKFGFDVFMDFYKHLTGRTDLQKIFEDLCGDKHKNYMTAEQLVEFLNQEQRDPRLNEILYPYATKNRALDFINQYEPNKGYSQKGHLSLEGFLRYLMSDDNIIIAPEKLDLKDDMNQTLSHYFINSSHNTYLTGHQITGRSSVEIYRQCLLAGCRCIELDCWNGKTSEDEPIITHGYTMVNDVSFKDVVEAIAESAFKTSDYPVILSFENHCSPKVQAKMATYCRKIFGEYLLAEPLITHELIPGQLLPSPNQLLRKIIIKNKKKHYHHRGSNNSNGEVKGAAVNNSIDTIVKNLDVTSGTTSSTPKLQKTNSKDSQGEPVSTGSGGPSTVNVNGTDGVINAVSMAPNGELDDSDSASESEDDDYVEDGQVDLKEGTDREAGGELRGTAGRESEAGAEMSALVNYIQPVHYHSFEVSEKRNRSYEISSFVETTATNLLKEHPVDFVNYNKRQLSRIYPKGTRVDSSNYMPQVFWNAGCQLVALNFQTLDLAMQLNLGIFEVNGRSGYLLKPDFMRRNDRKFDPFAESTVDGIIAGSLSIKIISGQFLSDKKVGTYVEVESYGLPADTVRKRFKTKVVPGNGINPVYDDEPFEFKKVVLPELCVLRIVACEEGGRIIGRHVIPMVGLRPGYRYINLRNDSGQPLTLPMLFVHITVKDYVPEKLSDIADALVNPIKYQSELEKRSQQLNVYTDEYEENDTDVSKRSKPDRTPIRYSNSTDAGKTVRPVSSLDSSGGGSGKEDGSGPASSINQFSSSPGTSTERKDSKKTLQSTRSGNADNPDYEIPFQLTLADSIESLKENKAIQVFMVKLEKDLQTLKKRHAKEKCKRKESFQKEETKFEKQQLKGKTSLSKTRKESVEGNRLSDVLVSDSDSDTKLLELQRTHSETLFNLHQDHYKMELEIQRKYHREIYATLEKIIQSSQITKSKLLDEYCENCKRNVKDKMSQQRTATIKDLKKIHKDKNERARMKREIEQKYISQAVAELQKMTDCFETKKKDLERQHEEVRQKFEDEKEKMWNKLEKDYNEQLCQIQGDLCGDFSTNSVQPNPNTPEVTSL